MQTENVTQIEVPVVVADAIKLIISRIAIAAPHNLYQNLSRTTVLHDIKFTKLVDMVKHASNHYRDVDNDPVPYLAVLTEFKNACDEYLVWYICTSPKRTNFDDIMNTKYTEVVNQIAKLQLKIEKNKAEIEKNKIEKNKAEIEKNKAVPIGVNPAVEKKQDDSIASRVRARRCERRPLR